MPGGLGQLPAGPAVPWLCQQRIPRRRTPPGATWPGETPAQAARATHPADFPASGHPLRWPQRPPADLVFSQSMIIQVAVLTLTAPPAAHDHAGATSQTRTVVPGGGQRRRVRRRPHPVSRGGTGPADREYRGIRGIRVRRPLWVFRRQRPRRSPGPARDHPRRHPVHRTRPRTTETTARMTKSRVPSGKLRLILNGSSRFFRAIASLAASATAVITAIRAGA